jgi:hypothetical protein
VSPMTRRAYMLVLASIALAAPRLQAQETKPVAWELGIHGVALMNGFYNSGKVNNSDLPLGVSLDTSSFPARSLGATVRQTRLIGTADLAGFAHGDLHTEIDVDFFGGQLNNGRTGPLLHVRRIIGELSWDRASILIGQEGALVADVNPMGLATLGIPGYSSAGNLWFWIPQVRASVDLTHGSKMRIGLQAAVLDGMTEEAQGTSFTTATRAERSGRPMLEGRLRAHWSKTGELGVGGHLSWLATSGDTLLKVNAVVISGVLPLGPHLEFRGEWYTGQGLSGLGGGAIGQPFNSDGEPLKDSGGWGQLNIKAGAWVFGGGYGGSAPQGTTVDAANNAFKTLNAQYGGRVEWRHAPAVVAFEYRHLATTYGGAIGEQTATHLNLAMGIEF